MTGAPASASAACPGCVQGLGARDAVRAVTAAGLVPEIEGTGKLVRQNPPPGQAGCQGHLAVRLVLEPAFLKADGAPLLRGRTDGLAPRRRARFDVERRVEGSERRARDGVRHDSRAVEPGDLFVALGEAPAVDGRASRRRPRSAGAVAILCERRACACPGSSLSLPVVTPYPRARARVRRGGGLRAPLVLARRGRHHGDERQDDDGYLTRGAIDGAATPGVRH
jgi:hypothetical protein